MSKRIIHCTNFNLIKRGGGYLNYAAQKLSNGLIRNGHSVLDFADRDLLKAFSVFCKFKQLGLSSFNELFYRYCLDSQPDGIILGHADTVFPKTVERIRKALPNVVILQWNVDCINPKLVPANIEHIKSKIDLVDYTVITTADKKLLEQFEPTKHKVGFWPNLTDMSVESGRAFELDNPDWTLIFPASPNSIREFTGKIMKTADIVANLSQNIDLDKVLFSRCNGTSLIGAEYQYVCAHTAMGLNLNRTNSDYLYSSDRMAHLMGNGALALIDRRSGFGDLFQNDEAAFYQDEDELYRQIDYFRHDTKARQEVAKKGWVKYHALFNEKLVAKYMTDLMFDTFNADDYPWPTLYSK
jgi:hypothetical protein